MLRGGRDLPAFNAARLLRGLKEFAKVMLETARAGA